MKDTYALSKASYQHIISTQNTTHNNQLNLLLTENKQLTDVHYDNMKQMQQLITDNRTLTKRNKELEFDIHTTKEDLTQVNREMERTKTEHHILSNEYYQLSQKNEELKKKEQKLREMAYGKFNKE